VRCVVVSTYELGHQPFGVASAASWLTHAGAEVECIDLAVQMLDESKLRAADLIAFYIPMHTASRIAVVYLHKIRQLAPQAHICFFGLYAPMNEDYLRKLGAQTILGGEFEAGLAALVDRLAHGEQEQTSAVTDLARLQFKVPERGLLPLLDRYAKVDMGDGHERVGGYTEASRGCKHLCRHCPIVPVYGGRFRVVQRDVVLADVNQQVAMGAQHITFGDPDFFNGPSHALAVVRAMHAEFPDVSYDVTIKIEHLQRHRRLLPELRDTGCLFVTSAVEAIDDATLIAYDKNHTRQDFIDVVREFQRIGLVLNPTFVTFSPWTTLDGYGELLDLIDKLDMVDNVAPIQFAIRLLIPSGSRILELSEIRDLIGDFDEQALYYPWRHPNAHVDALYDGVVAIVEEGTSSGRSRVDIFANIWTLTHQAQAVSSGSAARHIGNKPRLRGAGHRVPSMTEPWYCCAEPTDRHLQAITDPAV
jgi:radical SAM superfamily enzyme YgiQ (UPF0313 family)